MHVVGRYLRATPERSTRSHIEKCEAVRDAGFAGTAANFMAPGTLRQPLIAVAVEARLSAVAIEAGVDACWTRSGSSIHTWTLVACVYTQQVDELIHPHGIIGSQIWGRMMDVIF